MSAGAKAGLVFLITTVSVFAGASGAAVGWLWLMSPNSESFGFAALIFSPSLVLFAVTAVFIGLWASHRSYRRMIGVGAVDE